MALLPMPRFHDCLVGLLALAACAGSSATTVGEGRRCSVGADCGAGQQCVSGRCVEAPPPSGDGGADAAEPPCTCGPGEVCLPGGRCEPRCPDPAAEPCESGQLCDVLSGRCVAPGTEGTLIGEPERCEDGAHRCLPGTACDVAGMRCVPQPPCDGMRCSEDGLQCWGHACRARRPDPTCRPAPLERLNQDDFLTRGGYAYEGIDDLEFDAACNAWATTMNSGTDYVRRLAPDGTLTEWPGIADINMGEVAVLRPLGGEFGGTGPAEVAASYICYAGCGAGAALAPQGVIRLERDDPSRPLPLVLPAEYTEGDGPFGIGNLDLGPTGLLWGPDRTLYAANVGAQGDLVRVDLDSGTRRTVATFDQRVFTAERFDASSLIVALEGGTIARVDIEGGGSEPWADLGAEVDVASLVRDPLRGEVYATVRRASEGAVASWELLRLSARGELLGPVEGYAFRERPARLSIAPDGRLYVLYLGGVGSHAGPPPQVEAFDLPETLP